MNFLESFLFSIPEHFLLVNKICTDSKCRQSGERTTKFHREKLSFVQSAASNDNSLMMNERSEENVIREPFLKTRTL